MAGAKIQIDIDTTPVHAALRRLAGAVEDLTPAMRDIGEYLLRSTDERFRREQAPDGTPWAPNAEATLLRYVQAKKGLSKRRTRTGGRTLTKKGMTALTRKRILRDSGALQDTLRYQAGPRSVEVGTNRIYGAVHQFGARKGQFGRDRRNHPIPWGDIPARPYLGLSPEDTTEVLAILSRHLQRAGE